MSIATVDVCFYLNGELVDGVAEITSYYCDHGCLSGHPDGWEEPTYECEFEVYDEDGNCVTEELSEKDLENIAQRTWDYMQDSY